LKNGIHSDSSESMDTSLRWYDDSVPIDRRP
jgi:hypothetical protein